MRDPDDDVAGGFGLVLALGRDHALDLQGADRLQSHCEHEAVGVDDLDLLARTCPQRAREVARVPALDHHPVAFTAAEEGGQSYITLKVS